MQLYKDSQPKNLVFGGDGWQMVPVTNGSGHVWDLNRVLDFFKTPASTLIKEAKCRAGLNVNHTGGENDSRRCEAVEL